MLTLSQKARRRKNVQVSVEAQGKRWDGKKLQDTSVCSITARYPDNIISEEDVLDIAAKAGAELEKINGALSLDLNTMYEVFGLRERRSTSWKKKFFCDCHEQYSRGNPGRKNIQRYCR